MGDRQMGRDSRRFRKEIAANLQGLRTEHTLVADGAYDGYGRSIRWLRTEHTTVADERAQSDLPLYAYRLKATHLLSVNRLPTEYSRSNR